MRSIAFAISMLFCTVANSENKCSPLWEDYSIFRHYRSLQIEGQLSAIYDILEDLDINNPRKVLEGIETCQEHLNVINMLMGNQSFDPFESNK